MDKVVLVTGASGGIGGAIAAAFARCGCRVVLGCCNNRQRAENLKKELLRKGGKAVVAVADVACARQVDEMFLQAESAFGPVQILVNAAGHAQQKLMCDISGEDWRRMMAVHVDGTFFCCQRALPSMIKAKEGSIVNISSMWGQVGASCEVHYSAAKAAVIGLCRALAKEVGPCGVRVNCVAPGAIKGAMMDGFNENEIAALCEQTPLGCMGSAQDVAEAVVFLASEKAGFITGQVLAANGGFVV